MDYNVEIRNRVDWIKDILQSSNTKGIVVNISGGKDAAVVASLCKMATDNVLGIYIPIGSIKTDYEHAALLAESIGINLIVVDLQNDFNSLTKTFENAYGSSIDGLARANVKPRLRMITAYAIAQDKGYLVAGTGNLSELTMGYFTKWGDGAFDFNPIGDLTATEIFEIGRALNVPSPILDKAPSAGLWEGQTDEAEMGISYENIDKFIRTGEATPEDKEKITSYNARNIHKTQFNIYNSKNIKNTITGGDTTK